MLSIIADMCVCPCFQWQVHHGRRADALNAGRRQGRRTLQGAGHDRSNINACPMLWIGQCMSNALDDAVGILGTDGWAFLLRLRAGYMCHRHMHTCRACTCLGLRSADAFPDPGVQAPPRGVHRAHLVHRAAQPVHGRCRQHPERRHVQVRARLLAPACSCPLGW